MAVKVYKPTTPARRKTSVDDTSDVTHVGAHKKLSKVLKNRAGRNNQGRITVRHRGGRQKRRYRFVDFRRTKYDIEATVKTIEYDPNRSSRIALVEFTDGEQAYMLAPEGLKVDDNVLSSQNKIEAKTGNRMPLKHIPTGMVVFNVELFPGRGGSTVRSAGAGAVLQSIEEGRALLKLPSGEIRIFSADCAATLGNVSNPEHGNVRVGKAGRKRHMGWRPTVRGKAMNPVDHPHGGGEGNQPIGLRSGPKTPQGRLALGVKTRKKGKSSDRYIVKRRK